MYLKALSLHIEKLIENYHKLIYYAIKGGVILLNYAIKHYFFDHNATRDFFSGKNYNLFFVLSGSGNFRCGDTTLSIQPQNLIIFKPNVNGRLEFINSYVPMEFFLIQLSSEVLQELSDENTNLESCFNVVPFQQISVRLDNEIYMLMKNLARKITSFGNQPPQFAASIFERGILQMFIVLALRACIHAESHTSKGSRHHLMLDDVFLYIQSHLTEDLSLERLENEFYVSHEHISREFKRQTGQTIHRYIVKARLDHCCSLIEQAIPLTEVYKMSGFGSYNHFFRAFKKEYGMTPSEYFKATKKEARSS